MWLASSWPLARRVRSFCPCFSTFQHALDLFLCLKFVLTASSFAWHFSFQCISDSGLLPAGYPMTRLFCKSSYETLMYLVGRLGPEVKDWNWGKLRSRYIDHLFVRDAPVLRNLLSVGPLKWGGNFGTLKAHHFEPHSMAAIILGKKLRQFVWVCTKG